MQETSVVTNRYLNYFLSSSEVVMAFHILLCRKHRQKWCFITNTVFWYRNSHSSPSTISPGWAGTCKTDRGQWGWGLRGAVIHPVSTTVGPECCLSGCGKERSSWEQPCPQGGTPNRGTDVLLEFGTGCSGTNPFGGGYNHFLTTFHLCYTSHCQ